ncbi:MAG: hypothetical protein JWN52_2782 [Actinomycetia bacterium]|nr:hypothetical protein [Actinomycetes bacterium]
MASLPWQATMVSAPNSPARSALHGYVLGPIRRQTLTFVVERAEEPGATLVVSVPTPTRGTGCH